MPKIQSTHLPLALRDHLFERLRGRKISAENLYLLKLWRESELGSPRRVLVQGLRLRSKICGEGKYPKTFLLTG